MPDWIPPSVSVHRGDWKLIRIFHGGDHGAHRYLLYDLRADLPEKNNLAAERPELVAELDALIGQFLIDTHAVVPVVNPAFDPHRYDPGLEGKPNPKPQPAAKASAKDDSDPQLQGWRARNCTARVRDGVLLVSNLTDSSFLGFPAGKHSGASQLQLRIKSEAGTSHIDWLPGGTSDNPHSVSLALPGGEWCELSVPIPATGPLGILRIYLPKQDIPVEIDWIEITSSERNTATRTPF